MEGINSSTDAAEMGFAEIRKTLRKFRENGTRYEIESFLLIISRKDIFSDKINFYQ